MKNIIKFDVHARDGSVSSKFVSVKKLCLGRYCSREIEATRKRLDEKRAEGYTVHGNPNICMKSRYLLTNEDVIEVQGPQTSGEVEFVAIMDKGEVLVSVGSDHNDRTLEIMWTEALGKVYDTAKSKQMAPAVVAKDAWLYRDVKDHWDKLNLRSYVTFSGEKIPYQDFTLSELVDLEYHFRANPWLMEDGVVLFGGTSGTLPTVPPNVFQFQPSLKGLIFPSDFHFEIRDPVLGRVISHSYKVRCLEELGSSSL
ncbi:MAG: DUF2848 family protein [Candidatus Bathyarchaeia archaeon]